MRKCPWKAGVNDLIVNSATTTCATVRWARQRTGWLFCTALVGPPHPKNTLRYEPGTVIRGFQLRLGVVGSGGS